MAFQETEKMFPIMGERVGTRLTAIPWSVIEPHEAQAQRNHSQSIARLAERGGLSCNEALAVLENREWREMPFEEARRQLYALVDARCSPHCDGDEHFWPFDYSSGDTCYCGAYYLQPNHHGRVCVTVAK